MKESEETIRVINKAIHHHRKNTLANHCKTWFEGKEHHYNGNVQGNKFEIWRFTRGAQGIHPVLIGEVTTDDQNKSKIQLRSVLNPLGKLQVVLSTMLLGLLSFVIVPDGLSLLETFLFVLLIIGLPMFLIFLIYRYETKYHINQLRELISKGLRQTE